MIASRATGASFFDLANQTLRRNVPHFVAPSAWYQQLGLEFGEIWFPSYGCSWWAHGSCNMCNYGVSHPPSPDQMVQAVALGLASFDNHPDVLWVSAFDVLDRHDVPGDVKSRIYRLLANTTAQRIISESHPGCVTFKGVKECVDILAGKTFGLEIGVESMDNFIRAWCIHKVFTTNRVHRAIAQAKRAGAEIYVNLLLAPPFLTPAEAVDDAVRSIQECLDAGANSVVLFPCHVKEHTLCDWLYRRGLYTPPSLWTVVETVIRSAPENWPRIKLAWLVTKGHPGNPASIGPTIEYEDKEEFVNCLMKFDETGDAGFLMRLLRSPSYATWRRSFDRPDQDSVKDRLARTLPRIGIELLGDNWWGTHGMQLLQNLENDWHTYQSSGFARTVA